MLVSKNIEIGASEAAIRLGSSNELPQDGQLSFFLKSEIPAVFPRNEKIEVASEDESFQVFLNLDEANLILQDSQNLLAQLDPLKAFGASAFGVLRFRAVQTDGRKGDWQPLATLVRLPSLKDIHCPSSPEKECVLSGTKLFLIDSIAIDPEFKNNVPVPAGYRNTTISIPHPEEGILYLKLRDDPSVVSVAKLPDAPRGSGPVIEKFPASPTVR